VQIENPAFLFLIFVIFGLSLVGSKTKLGVIVLSSTLFAEQANKRVKCKRRNWLLVMRLCSMTSIMLSLCEISINGMAISPYLGKFTAFSLVCEISLRNTTLRVLP
jgi:hypothetical protein